MKFQNPRAPVACITESQAADVCAFYGRRLPSEDEWEVAMRGWDFAHDRPKRDFPGRREMTPLTASQHFQTGAAPHIVGNDVDDVTDERVYDGAANVSEWTDSKFGSSDFMVRGGSFQRPAPQFSLARRHENMNTAGPDVGVRCVRNMQ